VAAYRNTVTGNRVMNNCQTGGAGGISIDQADLSIIANNQVHATNGQPGIIANNNIAGSNSVAIIGNVVLDNGSYGIYLKNGVGGACGYWTVTGNVLRNNTTYQIRLDLNSNNNIVLGNIVNGGTISNAGASNTVGSNS
jgi:hypothetical protein